MLGGIIASLAAKRPKLPQTHQQTHTPVSIPTTYPGYTHLHDAHILITTIPLKTRDSKQGS
jgi:hypothetical protein